MIGDLLRAARIEKGLSLAACAGAAGITSGGLSRIERGERDPMLATLQGLARALGVRITVSANELRVLAETSTTGNHAEATSARGASVQARGKTRAARSAASRQPAARATTTRPERGHNDG